jgi:hypothetical protein
MLGTRCREQAALHLEDIPRPNLGGAGLRGRDLCGANFERTVLYKADFRGAAFDDKTDFTNADLEWADLREVELRLGRVEGASLENANLSGAVLTGASLCHARLAGVILADTDLMCAEFESADLHSPISAARIWKTRISHLPLLSGRASKAQLSMAAGCTTPPCGTLRSTMKPNSVTLSSVRGPRCSRVEKIEALKQAVGRIVPDSPDLKRPWGQKPQTPVDEPKVTVDDLAVAQFPYLLKHNRQLQSLIDAMSAKVVLILGNRHSHYPVVAVKCFGTRCLGRTR